MKTVIPIEAMTDHQRLQEAADILANAITRIYPQENHLPVDFLPNRSVHGTRYHNKGNAQ